MKNKLLITITVILAMLLGGTGCSKVPTGNVGIKVYLLGSKKGVDHEVLGVGRYWIGPNEELYVFPTFTQNVVWTRDANEGSPTDQSITFQTIEGMTVGADVGVSYNIVPAKVSTVFQKYRRGIAEITDTFLRNMVRDAFVAKASTLPVASVYGAGKTELLANVEEYVREQTDGIGINIERIYFIGELRLPQSVRDALNMKVQATQMAQQRENEIKQTEAEAKKRVAEAKGFADAVREKAKAEAESINLVGDALRRNPGVVRLKQIEKWNGVMPRVIGGGKEGGMGIMLMLDEQTPTPQSSK